jgi:hypothetical protein
MMKAVLGICAVILALTASGASAQQQSLLDSPSAFVQRFYTAYLKQKPPRWANTVRVRPGLFEPSLSDALRRDASAQAKVSGESVGLDFDPFLGSQDPGAKFAARGAIPTRDGFRVEVFDLSAGPKPMVLVDVVPRGGSWVIDNIRYPRNASDLRSLLQALQKERGRR